VAVILTAEAITVRTADRALLDRVTVGVQTGDRIGVLGLNGAGKTTLLAVLAGRRAPDAGRVAVATGTRIETVEQATAVPDGATVRDVVLHTFGEHEHTWASDSAVRGVLDGLGLTGIGLDVPLGGLSGGERRRVALAAALVTDADLLVLDEPTNHLDIDAVDWLARHLLARRGALIVVTHDRWFLDALATTTWEVVDGAVHVRDGGYSDWVFARAERQRLAAAAEERRRNLARKELAWLRRGAPARTSKPRYRIDAAEALIADVPPPRDAVRLQALAGRRLGKDVLDLEGVTVAVPGRQDGGRLLLDDVTWRIGPGDRIGVIGPNGAGKSTLLAVLAGFRSVRPGVVKRGQTVRIGMLRQDPEPVDPDLRVLDAVAEIAGSVTLDGRQITVSQLAERFGFGPAQQRVPVRRLSGGERRRLQLLRVLAAEPNVLLLDEPTNDLDTDTLAALEDLLDSWAGTLVVVSHDRYLIERVTDDVVAVFGDGRITHLPGGVDEYLRRRHAGTMAGSPAGRGETGRPAIPGTAAAVAGPAGTGPAGTGPDGASPPGSGNPTPAELRSLRKELQRLDRQLESLRRKESGLHERLATAGADYAAAAELDRELRALAAELADVEEQWLAVAERIES
jgi:ATP-binding cassette subfamily F protein uup